MDLELSSNNLNFANNLKFHFIYVNPLFKYMDL